MRVENIFDKELVRNINGVVKAEAKEDSVVYTELDEYVITNELDKHLRSFFEAYAPAVRNATGLSDKVGVWVSGFFGSGKSHFIKILSYLLENIESEHEGNRKRALDFFREKVTDAMLMGDIDTVANYDTDVILFNIDSRANTSDKEDAILKVFLRVFNERVGYCAEHPHVAHLERELEKRGKYSAFIEKFNELSSSSWQDERDAYDFFRDELIQALGHANGQSIDSASAQFESLESNFPLSIKNFSGWINDYLDQHQNRNIMFLVDEIGQFIGKNTQMMLKLQTITEDLGTHCKGRAWVVVTSQADIDAAIGGLDKGQGQDFSKIQGRFSTQLKLSSSNTNEVIQKRLLKKTPEGHDSLMAIYAEKGDILKNQLSFDQTTTASLQNFSDAPTFINNYPFIPYHYDLVQKVFESIRTKGAAGKHLAMGERSLLDAFQSAAKQVKDESLSVLIPFYLFYKPIEGFLEPAVKRTIDQACEKDSLTEFDGNILKTLFLIRHVDLIKSTLDNLTTLSIDGIDADKLSLKKQIEESLNRLERQMLIARNGDEYYFLTNEEKEIESEIRKMDAEPSEQSARMSSIIFDTVLKGQNKYRYPANKQDFPVSRFMDGYAKDGTAQNDLILKVVSPLDAHYESYASEQYCFAQTLDSSETGVVLVKLEDDPKLFEELRTHIQTERFLNQYAQQRPEQQTLMYEKRLENTERKKRLEVELTEKFVNADIYVIGQKLSKKSNAATSIIEDGYRYVIENTFAKLNLLKATDGDVLQEIRAVLASDDIAQAGLDLDAPELNPEAIREVETFITLKIESHAALYVEDIVSHFKKRPYGWPDNEILLLIARLLMAGKISLNLGTQPVQPQMVYDNLTSVRKQKELRVLKIRQHEAKKISDTAKLAKDLFHKTFSTSSEKELYESVLKALQTQQTQLKNFKAQASNSQNPPGLKTLEEGLSLLAELIEQPNSYAFIDLMLNRKNDLLDFSEDFEDIEDFYENHLVTWQKLHKALSLDFKINETFLKRDESANLLIQTLQSIAQMSGPYKHLKDVNPTIDKLKQINAEQIAKVKQKSLVKVEQCIEQLNQLLDQASATSTVRNSALYSLQQTKKHIEASESIASIFNDANSVDEQLESAIEKVNEFIAEQAQKTKAEQEAQRQTQTNDNTAEVTPAKPIAPEVKQIEMVDIKALISGVSNDGYIETQQQLEAYLEAVKAQVAQAIENGKRVKLK